MVIRVAALRQQLAESTSAFSAVFKNPNLCRLELAAVGSTLGSWAYSVAVSVYAYEHGGGAKGVGLIWLIRVLPAGLLSPLGGIVADRFPRERVMLVSSLVRVVLIMAAAVCVWTHTSAAVVYVLAGLVGVAKVPFGPAESAIEPALARTPIELTAANVVGSTIDSVGFFVGPAIAGIILGFASVPAVFTITAVLMLWSAFLIARIRPPQAAAPPTPAGAEAPVEKPGVLSRAIVGFKTLTVDPRLRLLVGLLVAQTVISGALQVLTVSIALSLLGLGVSGVGYLNTAFGIGALVGAIGAAGMLGIRRLSVPFIAGAALWGPPIAIIGIWPREAVAYVCLGLVGFGNTLVDVAGFTLVQRAVPNSVLARVFGVMQMLWLTSMGIGAIITPAFISRIGLQSTLIVAGCFLPALLVLLGPRLIRIDAAATAPDRDRLELLRRTPIFGLLPALTLEALAERLIPINFEAGTQIIREGDLGDRFYVVSSGTVDVSARGVAIAPAPGSGVAIATLTPGDHFGEIALLHDVPRTATVTAHTDVEVFALEREDFLSVITSHVPSRETAESVAAARLTDLRGAIGRLPVPNF
jgi:MFS family permease